MGNATIHPCAALNGLKFTDFRGWCGTGVDYCGPDSTPTDSSSTPCGDGVVGNGLCSNGGCCSEFG